MNAKSPIEIVAAEVSVSAAASCEQLPVPLNTRFWILEKQTLPAKLMVQAPGGVFQAS